MNKTNTLAKNLKSLMQFRHITESDLARVTCVSQPVINRLAKGITTNPNVDTLRPIAKFFNVSIGQLVGDERLFLPENLISSDEPILASSLIEVPIITWERAAQWQNIPAKQQIEKFKKFIRLDANLSDYAYALLIEDSTMEPTFMKGTCIVIEPELEPVDRDYVVVVLKGQKKPIFKQILFSGEEAFLKSLNPDFDTLQTTKNCKIIGVAVQGHINLKETRSNEYGVNAP